MAEDYIHEDAALANLQDELEEKDRIIEEKTRELQSKDEELQEKDRVINEKTRELQGKEEEIGRVVKEKTREQDEELQKKDRIIEGKTRELQGKDEELQEKDRVIDEKTRELQRKKEEIGRVIKEKTQELQVKDEELQKKDRMIEEKTQELQGKDEELQEKDRVIDEKTRELQRKKEEIGRVIKEKTQELQVKDEELQKKDRMIEDKTRELQGKDEELREKTRKIGRKDMLLLKRKRVQKCLLATLCLTVVVVGVCVAKLCEQDWNVTQLQSSVVEGKQIIVQLQRSCPTASYGCHVSGPGLSPTANYPTHVRVELSDASGQPCLLRQNVTAELQSVDQSSVAEVQSADTSEPPATWRWPWSKKESQTSTTEAKKQSTGKLPVVPTTVSMRSPSQYEVSYTALSRGQHKLHVRLNDNEVSGSPFNITVYPDPTQLGTPVRVVTGLNEPYGIAINCHGEMVVSNIKGHTVSLLDSRGNEIQTFGSKDDGPDQMRFPAGVAVDSDDNVYVASDHKLQKFSRDGHLIKCVGQQGSKDGEFRQPRGVRVHHGHVYVCDWDNDRIQVFDTDLNFIQTIGSPGSGRGQFNEPYDLDFDSEGKAYISDNQNHRIQVIDTSGQFVRQFGQEEGEGKLKDPTAVHVMGQFVYVSDQGHGRIVVYQTSGQFVTSFGKHTGVELGNPLGITSDCNGLVYVSDYFGENIQVL